MKMLFEKFIERCHTKYHLQSLFPSEPFILQVVCNGETYTISLSVNGCMIENVDCLAQPEFIIEGSEEEITSLVRGEDLLSRKIDSGQLSVKGGYRPLLFVESVLWLTRQATKEPVEL
ncbi:hypothetical protein LCM10_11030 [Rossellomorea aquimaris]|uniref:hypothetical protein n=1 Tax=Rossellomorea aquimaris TaxID=189382 RepID=UPI001CD637FF|nr:hypothetical protein [Rossellomorea aquimaris]MCA1055518.1 hypothetical protein [Rossellomorea aquimaris]